MFYREVAPAADLLRFVMSFWEFRGPETAPASIFHDVFPDGCVSLYYYRNHRSGFASAGVAPLQTTSSTRIVNAGDVFWGMRIAPPSCAAILRGDPRNTDLGSLDLNHLISGLTQSMENAASLEDAIEIFGARLNEVAGEDLVPDEVVADALALINEMNGEIKVSDLATILKISPRQLQRRFRAAAGVSPKQFSRIRRLRATAAILLYKNNVSWADRAAEMGFADQAHMANEFSTVTKSSPRVFAEKLRSIEHGKLIK